MTQGMFFLFVFSILDLSSYKKNLTYDPSITETTISGLKEDTIYTVGVLTYVTRKRDGKQLNSPELINSFKTGIFPYSLIHFNCLLL